MPVPNRPKSQNKYPVQYMGNTSFDEDFGVNTVETLSYNPVTDLLERTVSLNNTTATGIIDAVNETVEVTVSPGASTVGCQLTGTWAGVGDLVTFEGTVDGTNWTSIYANLTSQGSLAVTVTGSNGIYQMAVAGMVKVRVKGSTWGTPGSCSVSFNSSVGSSASLLALPLPAGSNVIGATMIKETAPTDTTKINVPLVLTYDGGGNLITIAKTIGDTTYTKTLSYTDSRLTGISAWV